MREAVSTVSAQGGGGWSSCWAADIQEARCAFKRREALREFGMDYHPEWSCTGIYAEMGRRAMCEMMDRHVDSRRCGRNGPFGAGRASVLREPTSAYDQVAVLASTTMTGRGRNQS